jgi:(E)-2-((N-methylformamido)methylene)succinate hydrolase
MKPTLVLLHGVGLDHTMWEPLTALLTDAFDVVAPDLPGHGAEPPVRAGVTLEDLSSAVAADLPPGTHVVGFSLGALVAQHLAVHRPELVATLTCVSSVCRRTDAERAAVLSRMHRAEQDFAASTAESLERWYAGTEVSPEWVRRTEATLLANDHESFLACYRVFATADADLAPLLPGITAPTLAVTGEDDPGSTPDMTYRLTAAVPQSRAVVVHGARHMLPVERSMALADCVTGFIEDQHIGESTHV